MLRTFQMLLVSCILYPIICIILQKTTNAFHTFLLEPGTDNSTFTTGRAHYGQLIAYFLIVIDLLFIVTSIVGVCNCSMFCCTLLYVPSSFVIILMGKRELIALLSLSSWCLVIVVWLFLAVPWVCLQFVIVVFPDHTHFISVNEFSRKKNNEIVI